MRLHVGTSGYSYDRWEGEFYPEGLASDERLGFYAQRIGTVEINNTFYRMPKRSVLTRWAEAVPEGFRFVIKAPRRITHKGRLQDEDGAVAILVRQLGVLGDTRGPVLFQTPPYLPKRVERLEALVAKLPEGYRAAFEFRHESWQDDEVRAVLERSGHALCVREPKGDEAPVLVRTAAWGYVRLRAPEYEDAELRAWVERLRETWEEVFVFFKHEERAPELVERMVGVAREMEGVEVG